MKTLVRAALFAALVTAGAAKADVLHDQSDYDPFGPGFFNTESGEPPFGITMHCVSDVTVGGDGWTVDSITHFYSFLDPEWGLPITQAYLHVYSKTGPLPIDGTDDPTTSPLVAASAVENNGVWELSATGLALDLAPGEYWIGLTPIAPSGPFGPEIHLAVTTTMGDATASYDPFGIPIPMWFNFNPGIDASIVVEGTLNEPTPVLDASWGQVKSDFRN